MDQRLLAQGSMYPDLITYFMIPKYGFVCVFRSYDPLNAPKSLGGGGNPKGRKTTDLESTVQIDERTGPLNEGGVEDELRAAMHFGHKKVFIEPWWMP